MKEENFEWKKHVKECLDSTLIAVLATRGTNDVWTTPIYFSYDEEFNFYFISPSSTRHMQNIRKDPAVALSIITPSSAAGIFQIGLQVEGKASEVAEKDIEKVYEQRSKRLAGDSSWVPVATEGHFVKEHGGIFIRITPKIMTYVDTRYFGGNNKKVPLDKLLKK